MASSIRSILVLERVASAMTTVLNESTKLLWAEQFLGDNLISWSAKRQATLSRSSAEAEYRGVANVVLESCWLQNLLLELHCLIQKATLVYCDNVSAIYLAGNPVHSAVWLEWRSLETDI